MWSNSLVGEKFKLGSKKGYQLKMHLILVSSRAKDTIYPRVRTGMDVIYSYPPIR